MRVVLVSVGYADHLAVTLPAWRQLLPDADLIVATSPEDRDSRRVAAACAPSIFVCLTDVWTADGASFDKARGLDEAFGWTAGRGWLRPPVDGELCLSLDADVYPAGRLPSERWFVPDAIYGCARYLCESPERLTEARESLPLMTPRRRPELAPHDMEAARRAARRCLGYFQAFRYRAGLTFGSYPTSSEYDKVFRQQFSRRLALVDFYVLHLGPRDPANYVGRMLPAWPPRAAANGSVRE